MIFSKSDALILHLPMCACRLRILTSPTPNSTDTTPASSGYYLTTRFIGTFDSSTGDFPWLNITGSINGRRELEPLYDSLLCDIDVFQEISVPKPGGGDELNDEPRMHRACPPNIGMGYAIVSSPPIPLTPQTVPQGKYNLRAEAITQDGKRIFCVEGSFDITT